jgi:uncharacterized protein (DUF488 family)
MHLYTIGFTQKRAEQFFRLLRDRGVSRLVDIRLKPGGQLAGFTKKEDLPYFLRQLANGCDYTHMPELAPTKEILSDYRAVGDWAQYEVRFQQLMDDRHIPDSLDRALFDTATCCLLCSEATPELCHRRLVAERLAAHWPNVQIIHL